MRRFKLFILDTHPAPYRLPLFARLNKNSRIDLTVFFSSDFTLRKKEDPGYTSKQKWLSSSALSGINYSFLKNYYPFKERHPPKGLWCFDIIPRLIKERPDAILVYGYGSATSRVAMILAKIVGIPVIFRDEIDFLNFSSPLANKIKEVVFPILFKIPSAFLYSYTRSKNFYLYHKVPEKKLFFHPCAVDNEFFQAEAKRGRKEKALIKKQLGIPNKSKVFMYLGKIDSRKRVFDTVEAYSKLDEKDVCLLFVGSGSEEEKIAEFAKANKIKNILVFPFVEKKNIYKFYSIADVFVIPSEYDPSPKVMNEAMNFSLPVIVSKNVGTSEDLVKEGKNGFVVEVGDTEAIKKAMEKLVSNESLRIKMGKESLKIVSKWNFEEDVKATIKALDFIYKKNGKK